MQSKDTFVHKLHAKTVVYQQDLNMIILNKKYTNFLPYFGPKRGMVEASEVY